MRCNVGGMDRTVRLVVGAALILVGLFAELSTSWRVLAFVVAGVLVGAALLRFCPANALFGINTCKQHARIR